MHSTESSRRDEVISNHGLAHVKSDDFGSFITEPRHCVTLYRDLASSVTSEALLLLPNARELIRAQDLGIMSELSHAAEKKCANIRILCATDESTSQQVSSFQEQCKKVAILPLQQSSLRFIFFIVDSKGFMRLEVGTGDPASAQSGIGPAFHTQFKSVVDAFKTFYDVLWDQTWTNEELSKRDKSKDEFIAAASHELRTPIQPILGYAFLAKMGKVSHEEAWDAVLKDARRLQQLANDILDVSKVETGNIVYSMQNEKINMLLVSIVNYMKSKMVPSVKISVEFDETELDQEISMDRSRMAQVFTNLLNNAIKFTEQGRIKVESKTLRSENRVEISVSDTGRGIPTEITPHLFEKFANEGHRNAQNQKGAGLGLYICKAIVQGHRGEISAYNNSDGGATFKVSLPISSEK